MTVRRKVRVVAALIADDATPPRFLVQQRLPDKSRALLWEFPGGKVEPGESDEHALVRECREELDVELEVTGYFDLASHAYADLIVELVLYHARILSGVPKPLHANALRWATVDQMRALPFCEADIPLLDALAKSAR